MIIAMLVLAVVYVIVAAWFLPWEFNRVRPLTEPLKCEWPELHQTRDHFDSCYRQRGVLIDTAAEAFMWSLTLAVIWPGFFAYMAGLRLTQIAAGRLTRVTRDEVGAKTERLERELGIGDGKP